jgi:hypothetical protein
MPSFGPCTLAPLSPIRPAFRGPSLGVGTLSARRLDRRAVLCACLPRPSPHPPVYVGTTPEKSPPIHSPLRAAIFNFIPSTLSAVAHNGRHEEGDEGSHEGHAQGMLDQSTGSSDFFVGPCSATQSMIFGTSFFSWVVVRPPPRAREVHETLRRLWGASLGLQRLRGPGQDPEYDFLEWELISATEFGGRWTWIRCRPAG